MRVSKAKTAENRERILDQAARLFREQGTGIGVAALTEAAGLTHGGLYSQFDSKEELLAEAIVAGHAKAGAAAAAARPQTLSEVAAFYLSPRHRDNPGTGCFMAALGCEMARQGPAARRGFTKIVEGNIARVTALMGGPGGEAAKDEAMATIALMMGALVLARAVDDPQLSDRVLEVARRKLTA